MKRTSLIRASIQAISVTILITTVTGILFYFGLIVVNEPDRQQFPVRGIDISSHQGAINWPQIDPKAIQFVLIKAAIPNSGLIVLGKPYSGGVAPQAPIGGRYASLQTSHVGVGFAELPRCLNRCC